ncbi:hypothetical protein ACC702_33945 [Rhizobium ruizarguesonis]
MRIFISHKMPVDTKAVQDFGEKLALYAGQSIEISHAGQFEKGADFRDKIEDAIKQSDVFILFYTSETYDWSFCMLECGLFKAKVGVSSPLQLIVLHSPNTNIPASLNNLNAVSATKSDIEVMLKGFYYDDPWAIKPDLQETHIQNLASSLEHIFKGTTPYGFNFDLVPNFVIELTMAEDIRDVLNRGHLPNDATIYGSQGWQALFGKNAETGAWPWGQLVAKWPNKELYEFEFASMISVALERNAPKGCYLQMPNSMLIYRLSLRRYEGTLNGELCRFFFTAAPMDVETYWLPEGASGSRSTNLFHLVNLTWFVRRRLIETYYSRLSDLLSMSKRDQPQLEKMVRDIYGEMVLIEIQSIIRGIDTPKEVNDALLLGKGTPPQANALMSDADWDAYKELMYDTMIGKIEPDYHAIASAMYSIGIANTAYYQKAAEAYASDASTLLPPDPPSAP